MLTRDAEELQIFAAKNGVVVRLGFGPQQEGLTHTKDDTLVFNELSDLFTFLTAHFSGTDAE